MSKHFKEFKYLQVIERLRGIECLQELMSLRGLGWQELKYRELESRKGLEWQELKCRELESLRGLEWQELKCQGLECRQGLKYPLGLN